MGSNRAAIDDGIKDTPATIWGGCIPGPNTHAQACASWRICRPGDNPQSAGPPPSKTRELKSARVGIGTHPHPVHLIDRSKGIVIGKNRAHGTGLRACGSPKYSINIIFDIRPCPFDPVTMRCTDPASRNIGSS